MKEAKEKEYEEYNWAVDPVLLREKVLSYPHHLKYSPVEDWPSSMDADERCSSLSFGTFYLSHFRWDYFTIECQKKNISDINEVKHCALDSGIFIIYGNWRRFNVAQKPFMNRTGLLMLLGCSFLEDSHVNYFDL